VRRPRVVKRLAVAIALAALLPLAAAANAAAKTPWFTVQVEPPAPIAGESFLVVVRTWEDPGHSIPARFGDVAALDDLLVVRPPRGDGPDVAVPLLPRGQDRFEASLTLPAGDWALVAFPDRAGWASPDVPLGYPDSIRLTVRAPGLDSNALAATLLAVAALTRIARVSRPRLTRGLSRLRDAFPG
jgi:hypothetical protein